MHISSNYPFYAPTNLMIENYFIIVVKVKQIQYQYKGAGALIIIMDFFNNLLVNVRNENQ